jgi:cell division protein ZapA (FtsZ GTPase activity inhibitor)
LSSPEKFHRVEVEILGQRLVLRSQAPPEYVRGLVAYVEKTIRQLRPEGGIEDPMKFAVLAALTITDELFQTRDDRAQGEVETVKRVNGLLRLLNEAAPPPKLGSSGN